MKGTVKVFMPQKEMGSLKAFASLTIDDSLVITGIKLVEGKNGLFINFPQYKSGDEYKDVVFPLTKELRDNVTKLVVDEYNNVKKTTKSNDDNL